MNMYVSIGGVYQWFLLPLMSYKLLYQSDQLTAVMQCSYLFVLTMHPYSQIYKSRDLTLHLILQPDDALSSESVELWVSRGVKEFVNPK